MSEWIIAGSAATQAVFTVVLVGVTWFYALQTKKTVEVMDRNNKAEFLPVIQLGIIPRSSDDHSLHITLQNVGKGLAKRPIRIIFPGVAPIYVNSMPPQGEVSRATINYDIGYILTLPERERKIVIEYEDVFCRQIRTEAPLLETHTFGQNGDGRGIYWEAWSPVIP